MCPSNFYAFSAKIDAFHTTDYHFNTFQNSYPYIYVFSKFGCKREHCENKRQLSLII